MKKKMLYLMHIDWDWIKQRPHFIAEYLQQNYDLIVVYPYSRKRSILTINSKVGMVFKPFIPIPFRFKYPLIYMINRIFVKMFIRILLKSYKPDFIWITHPEMIDYLPLEYESKILYDCMDDALAFNQSKSYFYTRLFQLERKLIQCTSLIVVTSKNLLNVLNTRYNCNNKDVILIRNAFGGEVMSENQLIEGSKSTGRKPYKFGYIGTISSWFDFEAIYISLQNIKDIEFHIIGPVEGDITKLTHPRIKVYGPVEHNKLYSYIQDFDCMVMPFIVNELIQSVDPVKLYEYINYNKPVISVYYPEIDRFSPYVSFYSSKESLKDIIINMINSGFYKKYSNKQRIEFLKANCWQSRIEEINNLLERF